MLGRKEDVAWGMVQPSDPKARYNSKPIPPNYALAEVVWRHDDFKEDELVFPTKDGTTFISKILGSRMLWNKATIVFEMPTPASQPSRPSSSLPSGPSDDDNNDNGGNANDNVVGPSSSPRCSPRPNMSNPS